MKLLNDYKWCKQCALEWTDDTPFEQIRDAVKLNRKPFRVFLKCLRKYNKSMWHKVIDK